MATRLQDSFGAVYALLERPVVARRVVAVVLVIHTFLLAYSAYVHSPTLNEPAHLVAGLSHWKFGRFEIYRVNPPLVKMVAALPVMAVGYREDWSGFYEGPGARPEMGMGENFVKANGERSFFLFMIARWACIPFSWLGAIVCYLWARDLYGRPAGVLAATLWCFEPNILAHASLMTPDAHATALGLAACYTFWCWLKKPTWGQAALTGVVLGLAELAKTTLILFYPLWPLMWLVYRLAGSGSFFAPTHDAWQTTAAAKKVPDPLLARMTSRDWLREAGMLVLRMAVGLHVLNLGYGFEGSFTQLKDFHFVSDLFTGSDENRASGIQRPASNNEHTFPTNRFAETWLGELPVPFPKNYLSGIDIQQKDFEHYGRPSYLRGEWRDHGWWYYYLYACAIKVPLGLWLLGITVAICQVSVTVHRRGKDHSENHNFELPINKWQIADSQQNTFPSPNGRRLGRGHFRDEFILLFPAIVIFTVVSSKTGFSEHMRYVLPAFPYLFIFVAQSARLVSPRTEKLAARWLTIAPQIAYKESPSDGEVSPTKWERQMALLPATFVASLGSWLIASSLWVYPHSLSYFNESIGGPLNGPDHLLGSNVDWGQDLRYVKSWVLERKCQSPEMFVLYYLSYQDYVRLGQPAPYRADSIRCGVSGETDFENSASGFVASENIRGNVCAIVSRSFLIRECQESTLGICMVTANVTLPAISPDTRPSDQICYSISAYCWNGEFLGR